MRRILDGLEGCVNFGVALLSRTFDFLLERLDHLFALAALLLQCSNVRLLLLCLFAQLVDLVADGEERHAQLLALRERLAFPSAVLRQVRFCLLHEVLLARLCAC